MHPPLFLHPLSSRSPTVFDAYFPPALVPIIGRRWSLEEGWCLFGDTSGKTLDFPSTPPKSDKVCTTCKECCGRCAPFTTCTALTTTQCLLLFKVTTSFLWNASEQSPFLHWWSSTTSLVEFHPLLVTRLQDVEQRIEI